MVASSATSGCQVRRDCLAASRAVERQRASPLAIRSPFHTATERVGRPRHDPGHADLGEQLDGQLAPVALRQRLHHRDRRLRLGWDSTLVASTVKTRLPVLVTEPVSEAPAPSVSTTDSPTRSRRTATA